MNRTLVKAAIEATQSIFQQVLGWELKVNGIALETSPCDGVCELNAIIVVKGDVSGAFIFQCTEMQSATLASQILGMECDPGSADAKDAVGELLNMIVGGIKNHYRNERDPFMMSVPTMVSGTDFTVHVHCQQQMDEIVSLGFEHEESGERFGLRVMTVSR